MPNFASSFFTRFYLQYLPSQVGPIPIEDGIGKEVATQITTTMETNKTFYTDSNGRDFIKRVKCCSVYLLHLALWCGAVQWRCIQADLEKLFGFHCLNLLFISNLQLFLNQFFSNCNHKSYHNVKHIQYPSFHIHAQNGCWLKILISSQQCLGLSFENRCEHS